MGTSYIRTLSGILKIVEELFNFIGFVCIVAVGTTPSGDGFLGASVGGFIITGAFLILYLFDLNDSIAAPWNRIEFFYCIIWALYYLIISSIIIDYRIHNSYTAAGVFGLLNVIVYLVDAYDKYKTAAVV